MLANNKLLVFCVGKFEAVLMLFTHLPGQNLANTITHPRSQIICPDFHGWSSITKDADIYILFPLLQEKPSLEMPRCLYNLCHCKFDGCIDGVLCFALFIRKSCDILHRNMRMYHKFTCFLLGYFFLFGT